MVKIPTRQSTEFSTTYMLNQTLVDTGRRSQRLGMASLGAKCVRQLWLKFRWARIGSTSIKISRLFEMGNGVEAQVIKDLEALGVEITDRQAPVHGWGGHIFGFIDGIAHNVYEAPKTPHLLEVKSMNDRNFNALVSKGIKDSKLEHYVQCQMYMGKLRLTRTLYIAVNKNTSEAYAIRFEYDEVEYRFYMGRGMDVVGSETSPPNMINDEKNFACRFCDFVPICYGGEDYLKSCRTCVHVNLEDEGKWSCGKHNKQLTYQEQIDACDSYRPVR